MACPTVGDIRGKIVLFDRFDSGDPTLGLNFNRVNQRRDRPFPGISVCNLILGFDPWEFPSLEALDESIDSRLALARKQHKNEIIEVSFTGTVLKTRFRIPLFPKYVAKHTNQHAVDMIKADRRVLSRGIISLDFPTPELMELLLEGKK
jgi:hypothetical protein